MPRPLPASMDHASVEGSGSLVLTVNVLRALCAANELSLGMGRSQALSHLPRGPGPGRCEGWQCSVFIPVLTLLKGAQKGVAHPRLNLHAEGGSHGSGSRQLREGRETEGWSGMRVAVSSPSGAP